MLAKAPWSWGRVYDFVHSFGRVEGSKQAVSSSFSSSRTYRQQTGVKKLRLQAVARRKAGAAAKAGAATTFVSKVEWLRERLFRFELAIRLNGERRLNNRIDMV